jgi:hypothetical protein
MRVLADVADDVGQLESQAQLARVLGGLGSGLAEDARRHLADHAGHQVAVPLERLEVQVARLVQVHPAAFDDGLQLPLLDAVGG